MPENVFRPATLLRKCFWHRCFPVNFTKFLRTPFSQSTSGRLLLLQAESLNDNTEGVYYLPNLQVESLILYKPESSFANIFPDFLKTISFFTFWNFGAVLTKTRNDLKPADTTQKLPETT